MDIQTKNKWSMSEYDKIRNAKTTRTKPVLGPNCMILYRTLDIWYHQVRTQKSLAPLDKIFIVKKTKNEINLTYWTNRVMKD